VPRLLTTVSTERRRGLFNLFGFFASLADDFVSGVIQVFCAGNLCFQLSSLLHERSGFFSGVQMFEEGFVRFFAAAQVSDP